jgi:hypothetical protein
MNRWDEIQATARDAADWVCADPADRNRMANDLIKLVGLMIQAAGKGVAMDGEGDMGQGDHTCDEPTACAGDCDQTMHDAKAHNRYLMGERMQTAAQQVVDESVSADIERYERDGLAPAWVSRRVAARDGEEPVTRNVRGNCSGCGVRPGSGLTHDDGCRAVAQTWGAGTWTAQPDGKLSLVPPQKPVTGLPCGAVDADDLDACGACFSCRRSRQLKQPAACPDHGTPTCPKDSDCHRVMGDESSPFGPVQRWGKLPQAPQQPVSQDCPFIPGDATPACDFDPSCPVHGILGQPPQRS